jgi:peptidylprolyl isomerase
VPSAHPVGALGRASLASSLALRDVRIPLVVISLCTALAFAGCGDDDSTTETTGATDTNAAESTEATGEKTKPAVAVPQGAPPQQLETKDLEPGSGAEAKSGDRVTVQYVGVNYESGEEFDASWDRGEPFSFSLGTGEVIPGWDQGVEGMKEGGRRELIVPPELAYGESGSPPAIPPNETLIFVVDLVKVG